MLSFLLLCAQAAPPPQAAPKTQNEFNPTITVFSDILWRLDNKDVFGVDHEGNPIQKDDKFLLRETEIDFRAAIDPYADGVFILALEQEVPGEFEVDVEEGYVRIKSLPFGAWEEPPLGTKIKAGRFLTSTGRQNRLHTHDLAQPQRGLTVENFLGEHSYIANGVSTESFLPLNLQMTFEALQGGGFVMGENGTERPTYIGNLAWFDTFAEAHDVEIAAIALYGSNDEEGRRQVQLYSLDILYKWDALLLSGQAFYGVGEFEEDTNADGFIDVTGRNRAWGWFAYAQVRLDRRWYAGLRYDWTEYLENRDDEAWRATPYVSLYVSEFFRFRVAYEFTQSDVHADDDLHTFLFQLTVVFGSHPPHPYWVNP